LAAATARVILLDWLKPIFYFYIFFKGCNRAHLHNRKVGLDAQCEVKFDSANSMESTCHTP
jgi:hypothetical protein